MKKNKLSILSAYSFLVALILSLAEKASAQWALPDGNDFNLPGDINVGIMNLTNWLLGFSVMLSVLALIWGGLNYVFSSGDTQKADLSKRIIYYALIGIFVSGIAYAIINTVVTRLLI